MSLPLPTFSSLSLSLLFFAGLKAYEERNKLLGRVLVPREQEWQEGWMQADHEDRIIYNLYASPLLLVLSNQGGMA
jgi:hypothetical protein